MFSLLEDYKKRDNQFQYMYLKSATLSKFAYFNDLFAHIIWLVAPVIYCRASESEAYALCKEIEICMPNSDYYIGNSLTQTKMKATLT